MKLLLLALDNVILVIARSHPESGALPTGKRPTRGSYVVTQLVCIHSMHRVGSHWLTNKQRFLGFRGLPTPSRENHQDGLS